MRADPTFRDPDNSVDPGSPEVRFVIDRVKAADLGVQAGSISQALNIAAAGQRVSTFNEGTQQYDVVIQADEPFRRTRDNLQYFTVNASPGTSGQTSGTSGSTPVISGAPSGASGTTSRIPVQLDKLVTNVEARSPGSIARLNRQRVVTIS